MCINAYNLLKIFTLHQENIMATKKQLFLPCYGEKYLLAFLLGFGCLLFSLLPIMIVENGYFIYGGDYNSQQINFYHTVNTAVRNGQFGWHWFTDLGTDLMTSYSFYLFGSPFFWLSAILPAGAVTYAMPVLLALKHGMASLTAYAYIRRFVRSKESALIGGLLYAFSGFQVYNIFFNHFQDVTAFFPLMLIAMEEFINKNRRGIFALTVALMALINYYFFAGQAVFLVFYYLFRMKCPDFHTSWKKFAGLAFEAVVGTAIAAVIMLPSALDIIGNSRITEMEYGINMVIYPDNTLIPRIIQSFFMPPDPPANPNLFYSDYEKWASIGGYFPLFSMVGVAAFIKSRKKHWASRLSFFCIICAFIPLLNSLFQAFNFYYYARWFYMPILIFAMMTAQSLDNEDADLKFGFRFNAIILAVFAVIGILPTEGKGGKTLFLRLPNDMPYFWIVVLVAIAGLIGCHILFKRRKKGKPFLKLGIIMTSVASVICIFTTIFYDAADIDSAKEYIAADINGKNGVYEEVSNNNFFRADISEDCDNYTMYWELPSIRTFHSVVNPSIMDFYKSLGMTRDVASRADITHYTLRGLLSVKYYYRSLRGNKTYDEIKGNSSGVQENTVVPGTDTGLNNADITQYLPGFEYTGKNECFEIYENKLFIPMGFGYDSYVSEKNAKNLNDKQREAVLMDSLILSSEQIARYSDILTENTAKTDLTKDDYKSLCLKKQQNASSSFTYDSKGFRSEIILGKPQLVFYSVPYSKGWSAEVNGRSADIEKVSYGFMAVKAEEGANTIVFRYKTPGLDMGILISASALILLILYLVITRFTSNDDKYPPHTHYYDYSSAEKPKAHNEYCKSLYKK